MTLHLHESFTARVVEGLENGALDVGILRDGDPVPGITVNPLMTGHLEPYRDRTRPRIRRIRVEGRGPLRLVAEVEEQPALPAPGAWEHVLVTPAYVGWRVATSSGSLVARGIAADFRESEPPRTAFWSVYGRGTVQNFAAVDGVFHWSQAGRYLFVLTPRLLLRPGRYTLTVVAANASGGSTARSGLRTTKTDGICR